MNLEQAFEKAIAIFSSKKKGELRGIKMEGGIGLGKHWDKLNFHIEYVDHKGEYQDYYLMVNEELKINERLEYLNSQIDYTEIIKHNEGEKYDEFVVDVCGNICYYQVYGKNGKGFKIYER